MVILSASKTPGCNEEESGSISTLCDLLIALGLGLGLVLGTVRIRVRFSFSGEKVPQTQSDYCKIP